MSERAIIADLRAGFGAEDIAVHHGLPLADVRKAIVTLRKLGAFTPGFFAPLQPRPSGESAA